MDNNGLNINRPLLSVRRFGSISSSSSLQKCESRRNESYVPVRPAVESGKTEATSSRMMSSGSVPFGWEHSPGKPKNEKNKQIQSVENVTSPGIITKLPPGRFFRSRKMVKSEGSKSVKKESSGSLNGDEEEGYLDALETLSRGETSFYSCSAGGGSGVGSDVKLSGPLLRGESKMRDFMLGRFLPAARAMASDVPQESPRIKERSQQMKKLVHVHNSHNKAHVLQDVSHDKEEEDDEYDSDCEYHELGKKSSKFCGLIPRFRSARTRLPISPAARTQASSSSSSSLWEAISEPNRSGEYKQRSVNSVLKCESTEPANLEGSKLYNRLQGPVISTDLSGSIQSTVSEQSDSSLKKKGLSFWEVLADINANEVTATDSQDPIFEKTLYTVHVVDSPKENSFPSDMFSDDSKHDMKAKKYKDYDAEFEWCSDDAKSNYKLNGFDPRLFEHPAPPPLPKSPSDSWLCRTLPSASSKKAPPPLWTPKYPSSSTLANDPKTDENIQLQSPQEHMSPLPES